MDNINLAHVKNRIGQARLKAELNRIDREYDSEIKLHNHAKQRFKNRWSKLDIFNENKEIEASDVVMYETHNPGFCYKSNGECRVQQSNITNTSVDMEDLISLLFTNDEIDIDKVLCLYLLSAHGTEKLTPPPRSIRTSFLARQQSPLERLVERSKKKDFKISLFHKRVPLYILDVKNDRKVVIRDQRLISKIIINSKILRIVNTVKTALEVSNPKTWNRFLTVASNIELIKDVLKKPKMFSYIKNLHGQNLISRVIIKQNSISSLQEVDILQEIEETNCLGLAISCESFYLEPTQSFNIESLSIGVEPLEELVSIIRSNILQLPSMNTWNQFYTKAGSNTSIETTLPILPSEQSLFTYENEDIKSVKSIKSMTTVPSSVRSLETVEDFDYLLETEDLPSRTDVFILKKQPKIRKNMQKGFSNIVTESDFLHLKSYEKTVDYHELANLLSKKVEVESKKDYNRIMSIKGELYNIQLPPTTSTNTSPRFSLKQTTCDACLNKWREPLPEPKLSKIKKVPIPVLNNSSYFSSKGAQRVSKLIDQEVQKFENSQAEAVSAENTRNLPSSWLKSLAKGGYATTESIEIVDLDEVELAKVRQKIRESENQKKFDVFMKNSEKL